MKKNILTQQIDNKTIAWLRKTNQYILLENKTADILIDLDSKIPINNIASKLSDELNIPTKEAKLFIQELEHQFLNNTVKNDENKLQEKIDTPLAYDVIKCYKINDIIIKVCFESEYELSLIHPKFAHLVSTNVKEKHLFEVFSKNEKTHLIVNGSHIGSWHQKEIHFFQGKFSMELIQKIHQKEEKEWMGIFHASALSNGKESILFLGDSGNGKSTSLSILQANGYICLADDFVPIDKKSQNVFSFPSAISIKKTALPVLTSMYPELKHAAEYHFKKLNKIVRYLPPNNNDYSTHLPCNNLVFIKYEKDSKININKINKEEAFIQLIPDTWLNHCEKAAASFLQWFSKTNCYQLTYSNNDKMISTVKKIFNNEL